MNAAVINEYGGPEAVRIADVPAPKPGPGEVLVRIGAAALNNSDPIAVQITGSRSSGHQA